MFICVKDGGEWFVEEKKLLRSHKEKMILTYDTQEEAQKWCDEANAPKWGLFWSKGWGYTVKRTNITYGGDFVNGEFLEKVFFSEEEALKELSVKKA